MARVTDLRCELYAIPTGEALDDATQSFDELELVVVRVETDAGTGGLGFTYTIGEGGDAIRAFVEGVLAPVLDGGSAAPRAARDRLRAATTFVGREGISELAISAVDIALWDALGRRVGAPLFELLGGTRRTIPAYLTDGGWLQYDEATLVSNAEDVAERGFTGMKMKVGRSHAEDESRVRAVRDALPPDVDLMLDGNCAYTRPEARRLAGRLTDVPVAWLEEPLAKGDYHGHADLRERIDVPIALGENYYNQTQFEQAMAAGAIDVVQPDVCRVGGISGWVAVAEAARSRGLPVVPHYVEPLHVHLASAFAHVPYIERHSTVLDSVLDEPLTVYEEAGSFRPPDEPGHGLRFEGLDRYRKS
jgi:L-alanine-DL-glutamate epimerase-like enolase superfamily enzyme